MLIQFVPTSTDSHVTQRTFLDATALGAKLAPPESGSRPRRLTYLWQRLDPSEQALVNDLAASHRNSVAVNSEQDRQLRAILNRLIDDPELYQAEFFDDVIEKEGRRLGQKRQQTGSLAPPDVQRLNRLALEAALRPELGNIYVHGWRPSMLVYGVVGVAIAALFWLQVRDTPAEHPRCNRAERDLILSSTISNEIGQTPTVESFPWREMLTSSSLWGNCLMQFTTNIGWVFLVRSMPQYLEEVHGVPLVMRGWMTSAPIWVGVVGVFYGGRLTDWLGQKLGLKWGRRVPVLITRFTAASGYAVCIALSLLVPKGQAPSWMPWVYVAALSLVALSVDIGVPSVWAFAQDVGGRYTASILGWGNMWGNLGAAAATPFYAFILGRKAGLFEWNLLFCYLGGAFLIGAVGALFMDSTKPIASVRSSSR
jgi:nitrate/nitrite transporter NarK